MHLALPPPILSIVGIGKAIISPFFLRISYYSWEYPAKAVVESTIKVLFPSRF